MANTTTVTRTGDFITLVFAGNGADYLLSTDTTGNPGGLTEMKILSIMYKADADGDIIIIREGASTGAIIFSDEATDSGNPGGPRVQYYGGGAGKRMNPCITVSQCTSLGAGTLTFELA